MLDHQSSLKGKQLNKEGAILAFWRSNKDGTPANHTGDTTSRHAGYQEEIEGPLELCTHRALHATLKPDRWKGDKLWIVALHHPVAYQDDKCGSLKREIICEIPNFFKDK